MRRAAQVILIVLTLMVGTAAAAIIVSQTAWFKNWLRGYIVSEANQYLNGQITIERLGGNLFYGIELEKIGVTMDGSEVVSVQDIGLDYSIFQLISKGLSLDDIRLNRPMLYLRRDGSGWSIANLIKRQQQEADREGPASPLAVSGIGISDATVVIDDTVGTSGVNVPKKVDRIDARMSFQYEPVHYTLKIDHISLRGEDPEIGINAVSGTIALKDDTVFIDKLALRTEESSLSVDGEIRNYLTTPVFNVQMSSDKTSLPEIARVVPALAGVKLQPAFELKTSGPLDRLGVEMNIRSSAGQAVGTLTADLIEPGQSISGNLSVRNVNLAPILNDPAQKTDLTGTARVNVHANSFSDLDSLKGQVTIDAPRLVAAGRVVERTHADVKIDGRKLAINGRTAAYGTEATANGTVTLAKGDEPIAYDLRGNLRGLNLERIPRDMKVPAAPTSVTAAYHVTGREPKAAPKGSTSTSTREVDADLQFEESSVSGATIAAGSAATVSLRGDAATFRTDVSIANLDLQRLGRDFNVPDLADDRYRSAITGHVAANGSVNGISSGLTLDSVTGTVQTELQPSQIGEITIDRAAVDADYHDRMADVRTFEVAGRDVNINANGSVALNDTGSSNLTFHADTPNLTEVGKLAGVEISGIAKVDGTITGNFRELQAKGTLSADAIKYSNISALTTQAQFEATVPDLAFDRARVSADTNATFVSIADQNINELSAKTTYADKQVEFNATAKQPQRSVAASGAALFHPDHQEVHLEQLSLNTQGLAWQLQPGSQATVQYGNETVTVNNLTLVSADQQITAEGSFGKQGSTLKVDATNLDLKSIDAVLMRAPQFSGRLNASAVLSGTTDDPHVKGNFTVQQGAFRQFTYDSLGGTVDYAKSGVTLDARLQQNPTQWVTAKGSVPAALFSGVRDQSPVDLTIDSSPIGLGIVQGFTPDLTDVTGSLEAHLRVTGPADDPRPSGAITVKDGVVNVVPINVKYTNIAGAIELQDDRVHIAQLTVLDNHQASLSINGDLAIRERQVGDVHIYLTAEDFKVIDNKMGNVRIQSNLELNGELRAPRIEGYLGLTTGRIDLDEVLAQIGTSPYSTRQTEFETRAQQQAEAQQPPGLFDALKADVQLYVPNDFVIKSSSLQTPDSPIGLGALNITLGGDLRAVKDVRGPVQLFGSVNTVRGFYDFQGRRFDILRDGTVRFDGTNLFDPVLDLRTERVISGVEAHVNIRGSLQHPDIQLTSTPPLEQADILALIVFNQPVNSLGTGQQISLAQRAQALAIGAVAGQLAQSIGGALNLDTFEIQLAPDSGAAAQVTLGQQIGQNLYLKVEQGIGELNSTSFILEYELNRWMRLRTNIVQGTTTPQSVFRRAQDSGADLIFFFSY